MLKKIVSVVKGDLKCSIEGINQYHTYFVCDDDVVYNIPILGIHFMGDNNYKYTTHTHIKILNNNKLCIYEECTGMHYFTTDIVECSVVDVIRCAI